MISNFDYVDDLCKDKECGAVCGTYRYHDKKEFLSEGRKFCQLDGKCVPDVMPKCPGRMLLMFGCGSIICIKLLWNIHHID